MSVGYIYILSNTTMPGLLKIGFTNRDVNERVQELSSATGVPNSFLIEYYCLTQNVEEVEEKVHKRFSNHRLKGKEFFKISVAEAVRAIDSFVINVKEDRYSKISASQGFCIRCKRPTILDLSKPYCKDCYTSWMEFSNPLFKENYCHSCGNKEITSVKAPLCNFCQ